MKDKSVILVVDDQPKNTELLEIHLVPQGYEVVKAASGEEALKILSGNPIDLVLLDVMMPRMSGLEVLEKIRANKKTRLIPVVMVTVLKETEDRVKALEAGCDDFISKPFDRHELLVRVKSLLRIKSLHDEVEEAREYAENIINTVRKPLISLDQDLRVVTVNRSFCEFFKAKPEETVGQLIYDLGNKQWDIPKLRKLLETILLEKTSFDNFEVEHDFATIGRRTMLLNARQIEQAVGKERIILLAIEDITERKQLEEELRKFATIDELTKVHNRRFFLEQADRQVKVQARSRRPFAVLMLDIDLFKKINDRFGHNIGDDALKTVCQACLASLRETDLFGRLGGEEFAALLIDCNQTQAMQTAERMRKAVSIAEVLTPKENLRLTISVGVSSSNYTLDLKRLIKEADEAMYRAKETGRGRVCSFIQ